MYLSQLTLNPRSRAVRRDLADVQQLHRSLMRAFPQAPETEAEAREHFGVLHRLDLSPRQNSPVVLVQSLAEPDWDVLDSDYLAVPACAKPVDASYQALREGQVLSFRLRANPTKKIMTKSDPAGQKSNGKRVALTVERDPDTGALLKDADQLRIEWLERKGEDGGFALVELAAPASGQPSGIVDVRVIPEDRVFGSGRRKTFWPVLFEGHLRITDAERFRGTLALGIGPAKAYGFGLLSLAPPGR